ncbi:MAG: chloride channel protein [Clostridia bacterium]|nr:chloride channel protein [Clostridia bacterium]
MKHTLHKIGVYAVTFAFWLAAALLVGAVCGVLGGLFAMAVEWATHARGEHAFLPWLMPVAGLVIAGLYRLLKLPLSIGTDEIITTVRTQERVPLAMAPAIFISTVLTHLTGGSAGREGAALQLGGSIGAGIGYALPLEKADRAAEDDAIRIFQLCGMAALFSALFGTPLAATIFVVEIVDVGRINGRALLPCLISAVVAKLVAVATGAPMEDFALLTSGLLSAAQALPLLQTALLGVACAMVAILFCHVMHSASKHFRQLIPNDFLRVLTGAAAVIGLSLIIGTQDYRGGGMHVIHAALLGESVHPAAFLLKIAFTALSLGMGYKGGEIVPSFFIGACLGSTLAGLIGFPPALGAAVGIIGLFCGVTNAPLASMVLAVELFGAEYALFFGVAAVVSYALSGHISLYHAQVLLEPKLGHKD